MCVFCLEHPSIQLCTFQSLISPLRQEAPTLDSVGLMEKVPSQVKKAKGMWRGQGRLTTPVTCAVSGYPSQWGGLGAFLPPWPLTVSFPEHPCVPGAGLGTLVTPQTTLWQEALAPLRWSSFPGILQLEGGRAGFVLKSEWPPMLQSSLRCLRLPTPQQHRAQVL